MATISTYNLKPAFQKTLKPLCFFLAMRGIQANHVTLAAIFISCIEGIFITLWPGEAWPMLLYPFVIAVRLSMNALDGILAREYFMQSKLGIVLNELGDVISDTALYLPLALIPGVPQVAIIALVLLAIISEMCGVVAVQTGAQRGYTGPMGKSDRALILGVTVLLIGLGVTPGLWTGIVLLIVITLLVITIINRALGAIVTATL
jgi:CDP-diacylglycerol--glycerol-3-phosphate 3-phosphatidyltransferase